MADASPTPGAEGDRGSDVLSDVLRAVRLTSALFFYVEASSPWVAEAPRADVMLPILLPQAQHIVSYHLLLDGDCYCQIEGSPPVLLRAGDIAVIPHGDRYAMSSRPGMLGTYSQAEICSWLEQAVARAMPDPFVFVEGGGQGESRRVLCGFLGCDALPFNPVLAHLPALLHLRAPRGHDDRLERLIAIAQSELQERRPGKECVLSRIGELMFVEVLRRYLTTAPGESQTWLAGLRDPLVGRALGLLHQHPAQAWTVDELARRISVSRSVLAERFSSLVGRPPMQYLAQWRMQLAAARLADGQVKVSAVALEVGYDSEAAFSRAFKALVGVPPATWRAQRAARS